MSFYGQCRKCEGDLDEAYTVGTGVCRLQCSVCGFNEHDWDWDDLNDPKETEPKKKLDKLEVEKLNKRLKEVYIAIGSMNDTNNEEFEKAIDEAHAIEDILYDNSSEH